MWEGLYSAITLTLLCRSSRGSGSSWGGGCGNCAPCLQAHSAPRGARKAATHCGRQRGSCNAGTSAVQKVHTFVGDRTGEPTTLIPAAWGYIEGTREMAC